jgi:hypothetical protein
VDNIKENQCPSFSCVDATIISRIPETSQATFLDIKKVKSFPTKV